MSLLGDHGTMFFLKIDWWPLRLNFKLASGCLYDVRKCQKNLISLDSLQQTDLSWVKSNRSPFERKN